MFLTTQALVLREVRYKEADRMLTLLTADQGKMSVKARGALRKSSRTAAATQQLTYSELTLFGNKGRWSVNEATVKEAFTGLRGDVEALALACYIAECLEALSMEGIPSESMLRLGLNSLYALGRSMFPQEQIKAAFEMKLMCLSGYTPEMSACGICLCPEPDAPVLDLDRGCLCCLDCAGSDERARLSPDSLAAIRYIINCPLKQLFSFALSSEATRELGNACERYLLRQTERSFSTLQYWKNIRIG